MVRCFKCNKFFKEKEEKIRCRYCNSFFHVECIAFGQELRWVCKNCGNTNYKSKYSPFTLWVRLKTIYNKAIRPFIKKKKEEDET